MTPESYNAVRFLQNFREPKFLFFRQGLEADSAKIPAAIEAICDGPLLERLPHLAPLVWSPVKPVRKAVSQKLMELFPRLHPLEWPVFDESFRYHRFGLSSGQRDLSGDPAWIVTALCHPDGRVRESALDLIGNLPPWIAACLLAVRANDWVHVVRMKARGKLFPALESLDADEAVAIAPLIHRLRNCGRQSDPVMVGRAMILLSERITETSWLAHWKRCSQPDRRLSVELLKASDLIRRPAIRDAVLRSNQRTALLWFIREILPTLPEMDRLAAVDLLSKSRAVPVRREWITSLMETDPGEAIGKLKELLCDPSTGLRSFARYYLTRLAPMDFAAHYRALLGDPKHEPAALTDLAEVAPAEADAEAIKRLESTAPKVRKAAILALSADSVEARIGWLFKEAASTLPGVAKAARTRISRFPELASHLLSNWPEFLALPTAFQAYLVRASKEFSKWVMLEFLLRCTSIPELDEETGEMLGIWQRRMNYSFTTLPPSKREEMRDLVARARLKEVSREFLVFALK